MSTYIVLEQIKREEMWIEPGRAVSNEGKNVERR